MIKNTLRFVLQSLCLSCLLTLGVFAQENTNSFQPVLPTGPSSFIGTVGQWLTTADPSNVWTQRLSIHAGIDSLQGGSVPLCNSFRVAYDVIPMIGIESVTRDAGIQGTIVSEQLGVAFNVHYVDVRASLYLDCGYNKFSPRHERIFGEAGLRVEKKVSRFVFIGMGIGEQFPSQARVLSAYTGIVF